MMKILIYLRTLALTYPLNPIPLVTKTNKHLRKRPPTNVVYEENLYILQFSLASKELFPWLWTLVTKVKHEQSYCTIKSLPPPPLTIQKKETNK